MAQSPKPRLTRNSQGLRGPHPTADRVTKARKNRRSQQLPAGSKTPTTPTIANTPISNHSSPDPNEPAFHTPVRVTPPPKEASEDSPPQYFLSLATPEKLDVIKDREDPAHETEAFKALKKENAQYTKFGQVLYKFPPADPSRTAEVWFGHRLGHKLYNSIHLDHERRGCECGLPAIYATREEAEAGEGTFRFYRRNGYPAKNIYVLMRRGDKLWHCRCDAEYLSEFALWVRKENAKGPISRKRKADNDAQEELLELQRFKVRQDQGIARLVDPGVSRLYHWKTVESMYKAVAKGITIMGKTVQGLLRNLRGVNFITRPTHAAVENGRLGETGTHLVVKRPKRQFTKPVEVVEDPEFDSVPSDFDLLPWFEWADTATGYIGEENVQVLYESLSHQVQTLEDGHIINGTTIEDIVNQYILITEQEAPADMDLDPGQEHINVGRKKIDLELSVAVHHFFKQQQFDGPTKTDDSELTNEDKHDIAVERFHDGAQKAQTLIKSTYMDKHGNGDVLAKLKERYPNKPPKYLPDLVEEVCARQTCMEARNFLAFLLTLKDMLQIDETTQEAIAKVIVDCDALHKKEVPVSFVKFPGQKGEPVMPGTFPEDVVQEVPADKLEVEPLYHARFPEPELAEDPPTPYKPRAVKTTKIPKGIMRKERQLFPDNPRNPMPGDIPRRPKLRFQQKIAFFKPIVDLPVRYGDRTGPSARTMALWQRFLVRKGHYEGVTPWERPEDQTIREAGTRDDHARTKFDKFLEETRRELLQSGGIGRGKPKPNQNTCQKTPTQHRDGPFIDSHKGMAGLGTPERRSWIRDRFDAMFPNRALKIPVSETKAESPKKPVKTAQEQQREIHLMLNDLELDEHGEVVHRKTLVPEAELIIAAKKLSDIELCQQIRKETEEAAERKRVEIARQLAEEKRQKELREQEERRKREEEARRRREEAERREKELQPAREAAKRLAQLGLRQPLKPIISTLPAGWQGKVEAARNADAAAQLVTIGDGTPLTKRDFAEKLLPSTAWLNDNIVNGAILHVRDWVNKRAEQPDNPPCAAMSTYFWPHLTSKGPSQCLRMAKRLGVRPDNFMKLQTILIPICKGAHWTLGVVFPQLKAVTHMDSFRRGPGESNVHRATLSWVKAMLGNRYKEEEWAAITIDSPQQTNGWDCGVFAITNSLCVALGLDPKLAYTEGQLPTQRRQLAAVLLNGGFKGDFDLQDL